VVLVLTRKPAIKTTGAEGILLVPITPASFQSRPRRLAGQQAIKTTGAEGILLVPSASSSPIVAVRMTSTAPLAIDTRPLPYF
jgi:hypothetical protein